MKSMTGYGSNEGRVGKGVLFVEIRGVNSRFLDINCKLPFSMYPLEPQIKNLIQKRIIRGKIEIFMKERANLADTVELHVNENLVTQYKKCLAMINQMMGVKTSSHLLEVVDLKDLVVARDRPFNAIQYWPQIEKVVLKAISGFDEMRQKEGAALKRDQLGRIKNLAAVINKIRTLSEKKIEKVRSKKMSMIKDSSTDKCVIDKTAAEIISISDRLDITEEITRLSSHIDQYLGLLNKKGAVGRQIDFLLQEMHREINTLGSKACDADISNLVVSAKAELEKLREQVQNLE